MRPPKYWAKNPDYTHRRGTEPAVRCLTLFPLRCLFLPVALAVSNKSLLVDWPRSAMQMCRHFLEALRISTAPTRHSTPMVRHTILRAKTRQGISLCLFITSPRAGAKPTFSCCRKKSRKREGRKRLILLGRISQTSHPRSELRPTMPDATASNRNPAGILHGLLIAISARWSGQGPRTQSEASQTAPATLNVTLRLKTLSQGRLQIL